MANIDKQKTFVKEITDPTVDFAQWYTDVVKKTQLVDYGPAKGTMVIRPYGYAIWELIQSQLDKRLKDTGHVNAYFPLFFPLNYLQREAEHIDGFAPEVAMITHVGDTELTEKLVVRPTSETVVCDMYSKWINSYRDLPLLINQWANVVRWEKTTRPFLRTSEFLWQEGHTVHATPKEAQDETLRMLDIYTEFCQSVLAIPVLAGKKTEKEKFAGAVDTYSIEAMMLDGKCLQAGTTHYLGDKFSKAFDIKFLDKDNTHKHAYQTSWGVSTRLIGAIIMAHGDSRGLCLPPAVAPTQAVIIPIAPHKQGVMDAARTLFDQLKAQGIRVELDDTDQSTGYKFNQWEMKGVPVQIAIGPKDIEQNQVTISRRDDLQNKLTLPLQGVAQALKNMLDDIQSNMLSKAKVFRDSHIKPAKDLAELNAVLDDNCFALSSWCGNQQCEDKIKQQLQATTRNMPFDQTLPNTSCVCCGKTATTAVYIAKAY